MKKNSVLDEEAYIYRRHPEESEGEKWKKMSRKEKLAYFNDYYRNKVIIGIIVIGFIASFLYTVLSPKADVVVSVAVVNDYWDENKVNELQNQLADILGLKEGKQEILIDDSYYLDESGMGNADKAKFDDFASNGTFLKISEVIKDDTSYKDRLTSNGYGISLKKSKLLSEAASTKEEMIIGIVANADKEDYEYISKMVNYILQKS